jgi:hypothetical protein
LWPLANNFSGGRGVHFTFVEVSSCLGLVGENNWWEKTIQNPARRKEDFDRKSQKREMRSAKWPGKQAVWINPLLPTSKKGDVGKSILAALACLSKKTSGERSSGKLLFSF